jgi:hypothetical protein
MLTGRAGPVRRRTLRLETLASLTLLVNTDRTRPVTLRPRPVQRPVTSVTSVRLRFLVSGAVENRRFISRKASRKLGRRERGTQTSLYRLNSIAFANVLTSPSDHHHVHVC